jgi:ferredoxin-NADP reductase
MAAPRKIKATVINVRKFADGVTAYTFNPIGRCRYRSGQFLHLAVEPYDPSFNWPESRVFSIANSPNKTDHIEILVAPKGDFTWNMVNTLKEGQEVWLKLPYGDFNYNQAVGADVVLIAGGTGISPFIPFLEDLSDLKDLCSSVNLYYGVRLKELIVFENLLAQLVREALHFNLHLFIENEKEDAILNNKTGILNLDEIFTSTLQLAKPVYYISGPKAMINASLDKAKNFGVGDDSIFYDKWE